MHVCRVLAFPNPTSILSEGSPHPYYSFVEEEQEVQSCTIS